MLGLPNTIKTVPFCIPQPEGSITQDKHIICEHPDIVDILCTVPSTNKKLLMPK